MQLQRYGCGGLPLAPLPLLPEHEAEMVRAVLLLRKARLTTLCKVQFQFSLIGNNTVRFAKGNNKNARRCPVVEDWFVKVDKSDVTMEASC